MITICDHSGAQICAHRAETSLEISFFDGSGQWRAKCSRTRNGDSPPSSHKNGVSKRLTGYFLRQLTLANQEFAFARPTSDPGNSAQTVQMNSGPRFLPIINK